MNSRDEALKDKFKEKIRELNQEALGDLEGGLGVSCGAMVQEDFGDSKKVWTHYLQGVDDHEAFEIGYRALEPEETQLAKALIDYLKIVNEERRLSEIEHERTWRLENQ